MRPFDSLRDFQSIMGLALTNLDAAAAQLALVRHVSSETQVRIYYGPPGTGKTLLAVQQAVMIADPGFPGQKDFVQCFLRMNELRDQITFVTFHPSLQYEDVVESIRPRLTADLHGVGDSDGDIEHEDAASGGLRYSHYEGPVMRLARSAVKDQQRQYVLVVDEINRGDVSRILGPLISALEPDKRLGGDFPIGFESQYPVDPESDTRVFLPSNLHIIGTMNSADRNIALVDFALRRRFEFIECAPEEGLLTQTSDAEPIDLMRMLRTINDRISYLLDSDHRIGHGYFMRVKANHEAVRVFARRVLPLLSEYFYGSEGLIPLILGDELDGPNNVYQTRSRAEAFSAVFGRSEEEARLYGVNPQRSRLDLRIDPRFWNPDRVPAGPDDEVYAARALRKIYAPSAAQAVSAQPAGAPLPGSAPSTPAAQLAAAAGAAPAGAPSTPDIGSLAGTEPGAASTSSEQDGE